MKNAVLDGAGTERLQTMAALRVCATRSASHYLMQTPRCPVDEAAEVSGGRAAANGSLPLRAPGSDDICYATTNRQERGAGSRRRGPTWYSWLKLGELGYNSRSGSGGDLRGASAQPWRT